VLNSSQNYHASVVAFLHFVKFFKIHVKGSKSNGDTSLAQWLVCFLGRWTPGFLSLVQNAPIKNGKPKEDIRAKYSTAWWLRYFPKKKS